MGCKSYKFLKSVLKVKDQGQFEYQIIQSTDVEY